MTRLKDVADAAGVSVRTVSNVVNNYPHVKADTRLRVQAAIDDLGYRPNLAARNLRRGRTGMVALAVPDLTVPYFAELAQHVLAAVSDAGLTLLIEQTDGDRDREVEFARGPVSNALDGLILSPLAATADDLARGEGSIPIVLLGERIYDSRFDHVAIDNVAAAQVATSHLASLGCTRIAAIGVGQDAGGAMADLRLEGYEKALMEHGLDRRADLVVATHGFSRDEGYRAASGLIESGAQPDGLFCFNDLLAQGALRALRDVGLSVPDDVAVVGMDDNEEGRFWSPSLTSVSPDKEALARWAVRRLAQRIAGEDVTPIDERPPFSLVRRESAP